MFQKCSTPINLGLYGEIMNENIIYIFNAVPSHPSFYELLYYQAKIQFYLLFVLIKHLYLVLCLKVIKSSFVTYF